MIGLIYKKNQDCLIKIPRIVELFRKQTYFTGNQLMVQLIADLNDISSEVMKQEDEVLDKMQWLAILQAIMDAQDSQDYILIADILEGDLLQYLQQVQIALQGENAFNMPDFFVDNMEYVHLVDEKLYHKLQEEKLGDDVSHSLDFEPIMAINGQISLRALKDEKGFCIHSTVNPEWEAEILTGSITESENGEYYVFGFGLGYHVRAILERENTRKVVVLESEIEILRMALTYFDWRTYLENGRLHIVYEFDEIDLLRHLNEMSEMSVFFLHYPSLKCVRDIRVKEALEDYFMSISTMQEQKVFLDGNFAYIQQQSLPECTELQTVFAGKRLVIVGGGPSVDEEMESIQKYRDEIALVIVGTVARKFLEQGIRPDAIVISDPLPHMYKQIEGLDTEGIPLILLSTAAKSILGFYHGPIYVAYQEGYGPAEILAKKKGYKLFQTGGSVSTLAIDMGIQFGAAEIILVGMDMAYTDNRTHAGGIGRGISDVSQLRQVPSVGDGMVYTSRNLSIYLKWIERRLEDVQTLVVYNTSRGARIRGTIEMRLDGIMRNVGSTSRRGSD